MKRLFAIISALSLLAGCGLLALWVRSIHTGDQISYLGRSGRRYMLRTYSASIAISVDTHIPEFLKLLDGRFQPPWGWTYTAIHAGSNVELRSHVARPMWGRSTSTDKMFWGGFGWHSIHTVFCPPSPPVSYRSYQLIVPFWFLILLLGLPPLLWTRQQLRCLRRLRQNHCLGCGYDLTANVSGTCPECGQSIPVRPKGTTA